MVKVIDFVAYTARRQARDLRANEENLLTGGKAELCIKALAAFVASLLDAAYLPSHDQTSRAADADHAEALISCLRAGHFIGPTDSEFTARALDLYSERTAA